MTDESRAALEAALKTAQGGADREPRLSVRGVVSLDGSTVYVSGMHLADLLAAFVPVRESGGWYLNITIEDLGV